LCHIMQYCLGVVSKAIAIRGWGITEPFLMGFSDSDYAGDIDSRRSRTGWCWYFCGNLVSWKSKLQHSVALSTAESEYMALCAAAQEMIWLQRLALDFGYKVKTPTLYSDNKACLAIANNPIHHKYTKHIDVRLHFIRELIQRKLIEVDYVSTDVNVADIFTKGLSKKIFKRHMDSLYGLASVQPFLQSQVLNHLVDHIGDVKWENAPSPLVAMAEAFDEVFPHVAEYNDGY
jgi:hypothetical protein